MAECKLHLPWTTCLFICLAFRVPELSACIKGY